MSLKLGGSIGAACVETSILLLLLALVAIASVRETGEKVAMNLEFAAEGGTDGTIDGPGILTEDPMVVLNNTDWEPSTIPINDPLMSGTGF